VGHQWIAARYVFKAAPLAAVPGASSGLTFIYAPSTFLDNPFIDQEAYRRQLAASCPSDHELLRAWLEGDWSVARGAYFAAVLEESRNAVERWAGIPKHRGEEWRTYLAHDFGSSAPSVTYVFAKSPGAQGPDGRFYARGSLVLVDELATNEAGSVSKGMGYTVPVLSERIRSSAGAGACAQTAWRTTRSSRRAGTRAAASATNSARAALSGIKGLRAKPYTPAMFTAIG
jgi:hypothetical protein